MGWLGRKSPELNADVWWRLDPAAAEDTSGAQWRTPGHHGRKRSQGTSGILPSVFGGHRVVWGNGRGKPNFPKFCQNAWTARAGGTPRGKAGCEKLWFLLSAVACFDIINLFSFFSCRLCSRWNAFPASVVLGFLYRFSVPRAHSFQMWTWSQKCMSSVYYITCPSWSVLVCLSNPTAGACPRALCCACLCSQPMSSWCVEARQTCSASVCLPVSCVLDIPGETAEETYSSKDLKLGGTGVEKSVRRNLIIRITTLPR